MGQSSISSLVSKLRLTLRLFAATACGFVVLGFVGAFSNLVILLAAFTAVIWLPAYIVLFAIVWWMEGIRPAISPERAQDRTPESIAAPLLMAATICIALPLLWSGTYLGTLSRLALNYRTYERIVEQARIEKTAKWFEKADNGIIYSVDTGPPVRVAFNPEGFLDNWGAIVFDPTGEMMQADGWNPDTGRFRAPYRITKLFGGDLVSCRQLFGDYYTCSWT